MFYVAHGWLRYTPHKHFSLPRIIKVYQKDALPDLVLDDKGHAVPPDGRSQESTPVTVPICHQTGNVQSTRPLYRLEWPGEIPEYDPEWMDEKPNPKDEVSAQILRRFMKPGFKLTKPWSMIKLMQEGGEFVERLPRAMAYHLAINAGHYHPVKGGNRWMKFTRQAGEVRHPVDGLSAKVIQRVLDTRFALDGHARRTLEYLRWLAESMYSNPMLGGFDTGMNETLWGLTAEVTRRYFLLLGDYQYDLETKYWARGSWKWHWFKLAGYLFWVGRTGDACVTSLAGLNYPSSLDVVRDLDKNVAVGGRLQEDYPDVVRDMQAWEARGYDRDDRKDDGTASEIKYVGNSMAGSKVGEMVEKAIAALMANGMSRQEAVDAVQKGS